MPSFETISDLARTLSAARRDLAQAVATAQAEIDAVKSAHIPTIQQLTTDVANVADMLYAAVEASPGLFTKPKTQVLFGIKVGFAKQPGKISWADVNQVVKLIKKHLPDQADVLIKTTEKPVKAALNGLPGTDLKRIGVTVTDAGDRAIVTPVDTDLDKLVAALLGDPATGDASEEEAA
jgi:hypothetical protein